MIARLIDLCARNRFLVFTGVFLLVLFGIWSMKNISLDALPDISDVQVIIHTRWAGQPPDLIEDQVTYPIVTTMLAAPKVKNVRAQTMFGDSYVYVIFQDGTDLYWARSRVLEYLQQLQGKLPAGVNPVLGPDATGAGWVYEYVLVDHSHKQNLADLRSLQDWYIRYQLETVPGVAQVATIGGFVRQYQVRLDPGKLQAFNIPLSTVIQRVRESTDEVGGRLLELGGAEYMVRGLGYFKSLDDLANIPVGTHNGVPVMVSDLGTVSFGPDIRRGAADWNGEGETVGGIVVMRFGQNALNVINGIKKKISEIKSSLPPGVEIVPAYDRSELIHESISTLQRDLLEEAIIVSLVIIIFLFHFRSALIPILTLPIAVIASFIPMYYFHVSANIMSLGGLALAIGVLVDAAIVMVENGYRVLSERQQELATRPSQSDPAGSDQPPGSGVAEAGDPAAHRGRRAGHQPPGASQTPDERRQAGWPPYLLFARHHRGFFPSRFSAGGAGGQDVPAAGLDQNSGHQLLFDSRHHADSHPDAHLHPRKAEAGICEPGIPLHAISLSAGAAILPAAPRAGRRGKSGLPCRHSPADHQDWKPVHAAVL